MTASRFPELPRAARVVWGLSILTLVVPAALWQSSSAAASPRAGALEVFVHPLHGGTWTSHRLHGIGAVGTPAPSAASTPSGSLVVVQRTASGDVIVASGPAAGAMSFVDLASTAGAPPATGRPQVTVAPSGALSVWYRTASGDLESATAASLGASWSLVDVTVATSTGTLGADPTVATSGSSTSAYAITGTGTLVRFSPPASPAGSWTATDPTGGLSYPALVGPVGVLNAPGDPRATLLIAASATGDLIELSNQLDSPYPAVGPWHLTDLTALGAPPVGGGLAAAPGATPLAAYVSNYGNLIDVVFSSGLPGGFRVTNLTLAADALPASGSTPSVLPAPVGPAVEFRTMLGDVQVVSATRGARAMDLSFLKGTEELVASDASATVAGASELLVAADGGPIATTALQRRILVDATQWDQQHAMLQTTPSGTDCNPFTAAWGRGSTWGCRPGTSAEAWCSDFAQWVWQTAGVPTSGITGWSATFALWGAAHHRVQFGPHFTFRPGDAVVWGTRSPLYGTHVAIVLAVSGSYIDVENGNDGGDFPGYYEGVWRSGPFVGASSTVSGYPVLAVVTPYGR